MADNKQRDIRNKRREKQRLREMSKRKADDWEEYANRELLDIGTNYDYEEYDDDDYPQDYIR